MEAITRSTISECLQPETSDASLGGTFADSIPGGNPIFRRAQHLLDSSRSLLEIYYDLEKRITMAKRTGPKKEVLLEDVARLEKLLETQAGKTKGEISNHLQPNGHDSKRGTHSGNEDAPMLFVRKAMRQNATQARNNWASEAQRLERNVGRLVKHLSDDDEE